MGYCPNRAIEVSHLFAIVLIVLITIPMPYHILNGMRDILKIDLDYSFPKMIIYYLYWPFVCACNNDKILPNQYN